MTGLGGEVLVGLVSRPLVDVAALVATVKLVGPIGRRIKFFFFFLDADVRIQVIRRRIERFTRRQANRTWNLLIDNQPVGLVVLAGNTCG